MLVALVENLLIVHSEIFAQNLEAELFVGLDDLDPLGPGAHEAFELIALAADIVAPRHHAIDRIIDRQLAEIDQHMKSQLLCLKPLVARQHRAVHRATFERGQAWSLAADLQNDHILVGV